MDIHIDPSISPGPKHLPIEKKIKLWKYNNCIVFISNLVQKSRFKCPEHPDQMVREKMWPGNMCRVTMGFIWGYHAPETAYSSTINTRDGVLQANSKSQFSSSLCFEGGVHFCRCFCDVKIICYYIIEIYSYHTLCFVI